MLIKNTHNYYLDYLKAFNGFLLKMFNRNLSYSRPIQKIEYNIGSKTVLSHKLYNNEQFEYPNIIVNLNDIRPDDEGIHPISKNVYGLFQNHNTAMPCVNYTKNEKIYVETRRFILNFDLTINVETNSDLFNYLHVIMNNYPINFTFIDYSFNYFIDITDIAKKWDIATDNIQMILIDKNNEIKTLEKSIDKEETRIFTLVEVQPEIEIDAVSKNIDKENMKYSLNLNILTTANVPMFIYHQDRVRIDRIVVDIDFNENPLIKQNNYPILFEVSDYQEFSDDENIYDTKFIRKSLLLNNIEINNDKIILQKDANIELKDNNYFLLKIIVDYLNPDSNSIEIPFKSNEIKNVNNELFINLDDSNDKITKLKEFLTSNNLLTSDENNLSFKSLYIFER